MTFGQTIKQLLNISGIKLSQLADGLGYDASYISRWANDIKRPSLKNNDDLFGKISKIIIQKSTDSGRNMLKMHFHCGEEELCERICDLLYTSFSSAESAIPADDYSFNAYLFSSGSGHVGHETFRKSCVAAVDESGRDVVECICASKLSCNSNITAGFFTTVLGAESSQPEFCVMLRQLVDMQDFANNVDLCCSAICTFTRYDKRVKYVFYESDAPSNCGNNFIMIESQMLLFSMSNPFSEIEDTVVCFDRSMLKNEFEACIRQLAFRPKILKFISKEKILQDSETQHFYNFVMDGQLRYFLDFMQPICMPQEMYSHIADKYGLSYKKGTFAQKFNDICADAPKSVVLYRSVLIDYIYNGDIFILSETVRFDAEDRLAHLKHIVEQIRSGNCKMTIINDVNPLLNREDTSVSFFLSRKSGFMLAVNDKETPVIRFRSIRTLTHFNTYFEHFEALDENFALHSEQSCDFVCRAIELLENMCE